MPDTQELPSWEEVSSVFQDRYPGMDQDELQREWQRQQIANNAALRSQQSESWASSIYRRSVPFLSAFGNVASDVGAREATQRADDSMASESDINLLTNREANRQRESAGDVAGDIGRGLMNIPALAGEAWSTGPFVRGGAAAGSAAPSIFSRAGVTAAGEAIASPSAWGRNAARTALMPSLYAEEWSHRNQEAGRHPLDPLGLPGAFANAFLTNAILGSTKPFGNLTSKSVFTSARNVLAKTGEGMLEQAGVDILASSLSKILPDALKIQTGFGLVGDLIRSTRSGDYEPLWKHAVTQAVTFAAFSVMHGLQEPHEAIKEMKEAFAEYGPEPQPAEHLNDYYRQRWAEVEKEVAPERPGSPPERPQAPEASAAVQTPPEAVAGQPGASRGRPRWVHGVDADGYTTETLVRDGEQAPGRGTAPMTPEQASQALEAERARIAVEGRNATYGRSQAPEPTGPEIGPPQPAHAEPIGPRHPETSNHVRAEAVQAFQAMGDGIKEARAKVDAVTKDRAFESVEDLIRAATARPVPAAESRTPPPEALNTGKQAESPTPPEPKSPFRGPETPEQHDHRTLRENEEHIDAVLKEKGLTEREAYVVRERQLKNRTLDDLGKELGLTRERIRQVEGNALRKLTIDKSGADITQEQNAPAAGDRSGVVVPGTTSAEGEATYRAAERRGKQPGKPAAPTERQQRFEATHAKIEKTYNEIKKETKRGTLTAEKREQYQARLRDLESQLAREEQEVAGQSRAGEPRSGVPERVGTPPVQRSGEGLPAVGSAPAEQRPASPQGHSEAAPASAVRSEATGNGVSSRETERQRVLAAKASVEAQLATKKAAAGHIYSFTQSVEEAGDHASTAALQSKQHEGGSAALAHFSAIAAHEETVDGLRRDLNRSTHMSSVEISATHRAIDLNKDAIEAHKKALQLNDDQYRLNEPNEQHVAKSHMAHEMTTEADKKIRINVPTMQASAKALDAANHGDALGASQAHREAITWLAGDVERAKSALKEEPTLYQAERRDIITTATQLIRAHTDAMNGHLRDMSEEARTLTPAEKAHVQALSGEVPKAEAVARAAASLAAEVDRASDAAKAQLALAAERSTTPQVPGANQAPVESGRISPQEPGTAAPEPIRAPSAASVTGEPGNAGRPAGAAGGHGLTEKMTLREYKKKYGHLPEEMQPGGEVDLAAGTIEPHREHVPYGSGADQVEEVAGAPSFYANEPQPPAERHEQGGTAGGGPLVDRPSSKETAIAHEVREEANPELAKIEKHASQSFPELWQEARAASNADPLKVVAIAREIVEKGGKQGVSRLEQAMMAHRLIAVENEMAQRDVARGEYGGEMRDWPDYKFRKWAQRGGELAEQHLLLEHALYLAGSETGGTLGFRRQIIRYDYSLGRLFGRARAADPTTALTEAHSKALEEASTKIAALEDQIAKMEENLGKGLLHPTPENFNRLNELRIKSNRTKKSAEDIIASRAWKTKSTESKAWDWIKWWRVNSLISGPTTYGKLFASSVARSIEPTFDNLVSTATRVIPGLREVAAKADIHGQAVDWAIEKAAQKYAKENVAEAVKDYMTRGRSKLDDLYAPAGQGEPPHTVLDSIGNSHAAVKAYATLAAFQRTKLLLEKDAARKGQEMTTALESQIGQRAYQEHQRAKFQADYGFTKWADSFISQGKVHPDTGVRIAANVADNVFPIRKIPVNIMLETLGERLLGAPIAAAKVGLWKAGKYGAESMNQAEYTKRHVELQKQGKTVEEATAIANSERAGKGRSLTTDQANLIMRQFNKGLPGLGALALGLYLGAKTLGGMYSGRRNDNDLQPGEVDIGLARIPNWVTSHQPLAMMAHLGAGIARESDKVEVHHGVGERVGGTAATARAMGALLQEIPYFHEQRDLGQAIHGDLGPLARSYAIPALLNQIARQTDTREPGNPFAPVNRRHPSGVFQNIQSGIPGMRQQVPMSR